MKIVVIAHQKGGVGKSTIAFNTAVELSKIYSSVECIDLDIQSSFSLYNVKRKKNGISELNISIVKTSREYLDKIKSSSADVIIVDVGGFDSDLNRIALATADLIITPVSDSEVEIQGLLKFREILKQIREKKEVIAKVVLNRIHLFANKSLADIYDFLKSQKEFGYFTTILRDRKDYKDSFGKGQSVVEQNGKAKDEFIEFLKEIEECLK
jgi:chromosome partitioning protein